MPVPLKNRKPWSMKWIVLSIVIFIPVYTYLTLHYRRPGPAYQPYQDMRDRADVIRLLKAGYRRVAIDASRPAGVLAAALDTSSSFKVSAHPPEAPADLGGPTRPAPGGIPAGLRTTLIETPLLPLEITAASAAPTAVAGIDYPIELTYTIADYKQALSGAHVYEREGDLIVVADFEHLGGGLQARDRAGVARLDIPPGALRPGTYQVTLVGERASRTWSLRVQ